MELVCPAAVQLAQATGTPSVLCGELHVHDSDTSHVSPVMDGDQDRTAIAVYCTGQGIPGALDSYCACPIWRAAKEALWARTRELRDTVAGRPPAGVREAIEARAA